MTDSKKDVLQRIEKSLEDIKRIMLKELEILTELVQPVVVNQSIPEPPHLWVSLTEPDKSGLDLQERMRQYQEDILVEEQNLKIMGGYFDKLAQNSPQAVK